MSNPFQSIQDLLQGMIPSSNASYTSNTPAPAPTYNVRGANLSNQDLQTLRNVLFAEISNRNPTKQALEAKTITNTALNRIQQYNANGKQYGLHQVLTEPNQYQGYNSPEYQRIASGQTTTTDAQKLNSIDGVIGQMKTGNFPDNTGGKVFYHHDNTGKIWLANGSLYKQPRTVADLNQ